MTHAYIQTHTQLLNCTLLKTVAVRTFSAIFVPSLLKHNMIIQIVHRFCLVVGQDSVVGTATRYGLDGPRIESRSGRDFPQPSIPALGSTQPPVRWVPGLFPGDKAAGAWS